MEVVKEALEAPWLLRTETSRQLRRQLAMEGVSASGKTRFLSIVSARSKAECTKGGYWQG